jgi:hypothetical protein
MSKRSALGLTLGLVVLHSAACGDRGALTPSTGTAGSTTGAAGSTTGAAGSTKTGAAGATTGAAGATTGAAGATTGAAGDPGSAGITRVCNVPCPALACAPGFLGQLDPGVSCCPVCRKIDCSTVDCAQPLCDVTGHLETSVDQCCTVCVAGVDPSCATARQNYASSRAALVEKYASAPCMTDKDCTIVSESNPCQLSCGIAVPNILAGSLIADLNEIGWKCGTCVPPPPPPCAPATVLCSNGQCVVGVPPPPPPTCTSSSATSPAMSPADFCAIFLATCGTTYTGYGSLAECLTTYRGLSVTRQTCESYHVCNAAHPAPAAMVHCPHAAGAGPCM